MNVKELREALKDAPDELEVLYTPNCGVTFDEVGNAYELTTQDGKTYFILDWSDV